MTKFTFKTARSSSGKSAFSRTTLECDMDVFKEEIWYKERGGKTNSTRKRHQADCAFGNDARGHGQCQRHMHTCRKFLFSG